MDPSLDNISAIIYKSPGSVAITLLVVAVFVGGLTFLVCLAERWFIRVRAHVHVQEADHEWEE